jgi:gliding motility-associated-like protein
VEVVSSPTAGDVLSTCIEQDRTYVVTFTISGGDPGSLEVIGTPGVLSQTAPYTFTSEPVVVSQAFVAFVRDRHACSLFRVEATSPCVFDTEIFVPGSFSPNGDGINENFIIPGIEGYPNNAVTIFNRWGGQMYAANGYDNRTVLWNGSSPDALMAGSAPSGTYFYVIDLGNSSTPLTGFIQLVR